MISLSRWMLFFGAVSLTVWGFGIGLGAEPRKIRISFSSRTNSVVPFRLALVKGFFKEEGLEVELIQANPRLGALAVMNGDLDFTSTFGSTLRGILQGLPLKFVFVSNRKSDHFLVVRPEIKNIQELKGRSLGVSTLFGTDQRAAEEMLRTKGFNPALLKILALGDSPVRAEALRSGLVDAISVSSPHDFILKAMGFNVLAGPQDLKFALPTSGLATTSRLLQERPQLIKRSIRALLRAHRFVFENRRESIQVMMHWLEQSPEVAERSYDLAMISLSKDGEIADYEWERLTEKRRPLEEVRDFTLLREAQKELGIK